MAKKTWTKAQRAAQSKKLKDFHRRKKEPKPTRLPHAEKTPASEEIEADIFAYALGFLESWIRNYAESSGVSSESLTRRLGKVFQSKTGR